MVPVEEFHLVHAVNGLNIKEVLSSGSLLSLSKQEGNNSIFFDKNNKKDSFYKSVVKKYNYDKKVFTGLIVPDENNEPVFTINHALPHMVYFILDPHLIEDYNNCSIEIAKNTKLKKSSYPYYCKEWNYADVNSNCIKYNNKKSLEFNLNKWRQKYLEDRSYMKEAIDNFVNNNLKRLNLELEDLVFQSKQEFDTFYHQLHEHDQDDFDDYLSASLETMFGTPINEITIQFSKNMNGDCVEGEVSLEKYVQYIYVHKEAENIDELIELSKKYNQYKWIFG